jgi:general secretion pathway protein N
MAVANTRQREMVYWRKTFYLGIISGVVLTCLVPDLVAAISATSDLLADRPNDASDVVDVTPVTPIDGSKRGVTNPPLLRGNPLWSTPFSVLSATRERPIFLASRRPPQRAATPAALEQVSLPALPIEIDVERPPLALLGTVVGDGDAIAVFLNRDDQTILHLRSGDLNAGWSVASVLKGEVVLTRAGRVETFFLQLPDSTYGSAKSRSP